MPIARPSARIARKRHAGIVDPERPAARFREGQAAVSSGVNAISLHLTHYGQFNGPSAGYAPPWNLAMHPMISPRPITWLGVCVSFDGSMSSHVTEATRIPSARDVRRRSQAGLTFHRTGALHRANVGPALTDRFWHPGWYACAEVVRQRAPYWRHRYDPECVTTGVTASA